MFPRASFGYLLLLLIVTVPAAEPAKPSSQPQSFVIGLSPYLDRAVKDEVFRGLVRLLVEDLPLNSTLSIFDAFHLKSISEVTLPNRQVFTSPKTRANQFAPAIQALKQFLASDHPKPTNWHLGFASAICLPQFYEFLNLPKTDTPLSLLLIGSPLYQDAKEPAFSMVDGYFPSDGHLQASTEQSIFGVRGRPRPTRSLAVHWLYFGDPWLNDLHREKVTRFWTLYLERHGGWLSTFSADLSTTLRAFHQGATAQAAPSERWTIDPQQTKVEMLRVSRQIDTADWITRETVSDPAQQPPATMIGPMKIGIRWKKNIDLDLYATPQPGAETLFFEHPRSPEGTYYKDHRSSPGREYEFIEFHSPVDVRKVEASVNFYEGSSPGGPRGEARIEFDGRIYTGSFSIPASRGNRGRSGRQQQEFWFRIPVQQLLKLEPTG